MLVLAIYGGTLGAPFIYDDAKLQQKPLLRIDSLGGVWSVLMAPALPRRIGMATFSLNYYWDDFEPSGYRLLNVTIHVLNALLLFALLRQLTGRPGERPRVSPAALMAGVGVWFVHPMHTQAVTYIWQRVTILCAFFYLATLLLFMHALRARTLMRHLAFSGLAILSGLLALGTKENAGALPVFVLLAGLSVADQAPRWRKIALGAGALALSAGIAACYLGPRWLVMIANDSAARGFTPLQRVMTEWRVNPKHVSALVNLGLVHNRLHDYGEAAAVLEQALALDGANVLAQDALIVAYYNAGRHKQASALARQALAARPLDARLHAFLGASLLASGERVAGLIELREALRFDPQQPVARSMLARLGPAASR